MQGVNARWRSIRKGGSHPKRALGNEHTEDDKTCVKTAYEKNVYCLKPGEEKKRKEGGRLKKGPFGSVDRPLAIARETNGIRGKARSCANAYGRGGGTRPERQELKKKKKKNAALEDISSDKWETWKKGGVKAATIILRGEKGQHHFSLDSTGHSSAHHGGHRIEPFKTKYCPRESKKKGGWGT